jgi:hypothetical protein
MDRDRKTNACPSLTSGELRDPWWPIHRREPSAIPVDASAKPLPLHHLPLPQRRLVPLPVLYRHQKCRTMSHPAKPEEKLAANPGERPLHQTRTRESRRAAQASGPDCRREKESRIHFAGTRPTKHTKRSHFRRLNLRNGTRFIHSQNEPNPGLQRGIRTDGSTKRSAARVIGSPAIYCMINGFRHDDSHSISHSDRR